VVTLLRELPELNRSTLIYLARFFHEVSTHSESNLMTTYNLAVIITPNLFRSPSLTHKDLLNHGTLTDVFTLIMQNVDKIIADIKTAEESPSLVNDLLSMKPNTMDNSNRANNRQTVNPGF